MPDPGMMLAWISRKQEVLLLNLVQCEWPLKKASIQLCMLSGIINWEYLCRTAWCLMLSNALEKSSTYTMTCWLESWRVVIVCRR